MVEINTISANTLRNWLEIGQPVSILDIRPITEINVLPARKSQLVFIA